MVMVLAMVRRQMANDTAGVEALVPYSLSSTSAERLRGQSDGTPWMHRSASWAASSLVMPCSTS